MTTWRMWSCTPGLNEAFRKCVADGMTAAQACAHLNRHFKTVRLSRNACIGRAKRMGLRWARARKVDG